MSLLRGAEGAHSPQEGLRSEPAEPQPRWPLVSSSGCLPLPTWDALPLRGAPLDPTLLP